MIVNPAIEYFELHLAPDADFTKKGWGRRVRALGGSFRAARGYDDTRYVDVPNTEAGRALIGELLTRFRKYAATVVIVRGIGEARAFLGDALAPTTVHYVRPDADPSKAIDVVIDHFHKRYRRFVLSEYRSKSRDWYRRTT